MPYILDKTNIFLLQKIFFYATRIAIKYLYVLLFKNFFVYEQKEKQDRRKGNRRKPRQCEKHKSPEKALRGHQLVFWCKEGPSRAIRPMRHDGISVRFLPFCTVFLFLRSLPSVFSHGRTQFHTSGIVPLRSLKNGDRWLFSYGRTTTTVRTRPYDGSRSSVRSQSPVLSSAKMGSSDAFFTLETV